MAIERIPKKPPRNLLEEMASAADAPTNVIQRQGEAQIPRLLERIQELEKERDTLASHNDELQQALAAPSLDPGEVEQLRQLNEVLQKESQIATSKVSELQKQLRRRDERLAHLESLEPTVQQLEAQLRLLTSAKDAALEKVTLIEAERSSLSAELASVARARDAALEELSHLETRFDDYQRQSEERIAQLVDQLKRVEKLEADNTALSSQLRDLATVKNEALEQVAQLRARIAAAAEAPAPRVIAPHELYRFHPCHIDQDDWERKVQSVANTYIKPLNARYDEPAAIVLGELAHAFYTFADTQADNGSYVRVAVAMVQPLIQFTPYFRERLRTWILTVREKYATPQGALPSTTVELVLRESCLGIVTEQLQLWQRALDWALNKGAVDIVGGTEK